MIPYDFHPDAELEFDDAIQYYENKTPTLGSLFREAVQRALDDACRSPGHFGKYYRTRCRESVVGGYPYSVIFLERTGSITAVAISHHKRRPGYWRQRLKTI